MKHRSVFPCFVLFLFVILFSLNILAQTTDELTTHLHTVTRMRSDVQQHTLKLLLLLKQFEDRKEEKVTRLKVITPEAVVREAMTTTAKVIFTARYNEEYDQLEKNESWYRIPLPDGRDGWVSEKSVQTITVLRKHEKAFDPQLETTMLDLIAGLNEKIQSSFDSSLIVLKAVDERFATLTPQDRNATQQTRSAIEREREKLITFSEYATHFTAKYAPGKRTSDAASAMQFPGPMYGQLGAQYGNSSYNTSYDATTKSSSSARTLFFTGGMTLSNDAQATAQFNHQSTILQTPFSSNDIRFGFDYANAPQSNFNGFATFGNYKDDLSPRNNFNRIGLGATARTTLSPSALLTADLSYDGKNYDDETGNSYDGLQFLSNVKLIASTHTDWTLGVNGTLQDSKISYMKFFRVAPSVQYNTRTALRGFSAKAEAERMAYAGGSDGNDFLREQLDLLWRDEHSQRQLTLTGKQFPNNDFQNYVRLQGQMRTESRGKDSYTTASYSALLNYYTTSSDVQAHYLDLRSDASSIGPVVSQDWNIFARAWFDPKDSSDHDHTIDAYTRIGFELPYVNVGPIVGAHLLIRKGEKIIAREGNSLRFGVDARSNFSIQQAQVNISARYEKDFVYGRKISIDRSTGATTFGELMERHPITFQFSIDVRYPILPALDATLNVNRYEVLPDVNGELSIDPIARRYQFNLLLGVNYHFGTR